MMNFSKLIEDACAIQKATKKLYIYGAGFYGKDIYRTLTNHGIKVDGFLVTKESDIRTVFGLPVIVAEMVLENDIGIVVAVSNTYVNSIFDYLTAKGVDMSHVVNGGQYITDTGGRADMRNSKVLEISTVMGCSVNCRFCPQDVLLKKYYMNDRLRQRVMTLDNFRLILEHTPKNCLLMFSGMTEPFDNPDCIKMIRLACEDGRRVSLFSTLSGLNEDTVNELIDLPISYMTLHVADKYGYAHILTTETYYRNVAKIVSAKKEDGTPFVDFINSQTDPDERIAEIVKEKYEVMRSVQNRAGNITVEGPQRRETIIAPNQKIRCSFCGDDLSNSVVLPDGTMLLCNMDYGMEHVLGNLYEEDYDTIRSKGELQKIIRAMKCEETMNNLLCRNCLLARVEE